MLFVAIGLTKMEMACFRSWSYREPMALASGFARAMPPRKSTLVRKNPTLARSAHVYPELRWFVGAWEAGCGLSRTLLH
jgi:hypothetical protein